MVSIESTTISPSSIGYRPPTFTWGRIHIRTLHVISPLRTPARKSLVRVMVVNLPQFCEAPLDFVEGLIFLRESEPDHAATELRIRRVEAGSRNGCHADFIDEPISKCHVVVSSAEMPEISHDV